MHVSIVNKVKTEWSVGRVFISLDGFFSCFILAPQVKKAFFALVANGVRAAPLWDTEKQSFVGKNHSLKVAVAELSNRTVRHR